jgi:hypothetical protein
MNYTKGEWKIKGRYVFSDEKPPRMIAEAKIVNFSLKEAGSNANLIAAAPKLYEALKMVVDNHLIEASAENQSIVMAIYEALAEVEGK